MLSNDGMCNSCMYRLDVATFREITKRQSAEIRELRKGLRVAKKREKDTGALSGFTIAVVGLAWQENCYKDVVEEYGGRFRFAPSHEKIGLISRSLGKADVAVIFIDYAGHSFVDKAKSVAERRGIPVFYVTGGLDSFETTLIYSVSPWLQRNFQTDLVATG